MLIKQIATGSVKSLRNSKKVSDKKRCETRWHHPLKLFTNLLNKCVRKWTGKKYSSNRKQHRWWRGNYGNIIHGLEITTYLILCGNICIGVEMVKKNSAYKYLEHEIRNSGNHQTVACRLELTWVALRKLNVFKLTLPIYLKVFNQCWRTVRKN